MDELQLIKVHVYRGDEQIPESPVVFAYETGGETPYTGSLSDGIRSKVFELFPEATYYDAQNVSYWAIRGRLKQLRAEAAAKAALDKPVVHRKPSLYGRGLVGDLLREASHMTDGMQHSTPRVLEELVEVTPHEQPITTEV